VFVIGTQKESANKVAMKMEDWDGWRDAWGRESPHDGGWSCV